MCDQFACKLVVLESEFALLELTQNFQNPHVTCRATANIWLGLNDSDEEGVWRRDVDGTIADYLNFGYPEPDGGKNENCAGLFVRNPTWYDWACDDRRVSCAFWASQLR
ncbi:hypothetical protein HAZT_HAZT005477 [Hyalella azteca]|uniref:C-type lectin domain-containing protein n=1 Tax=Hyalella azteca TaxID=294128 RepID=A0A6A0GX09_HYAAZ|nr:hypothetical protein HAZT_HAZT005477 [Hyalella azteca]